MIFMKKLYFKWIFIGCLTSISHLLTAQNWTQLTCGTDFQPALNFAVLNNQLYVGKSADKIYSSNDGVNWNSSSTGITSSSIFGLYEQNGTIYAGGNLNSLYSSNDGVNWSVIPPSNPAGTVTAIYKSGSNLLYGTNSNSGIRVSSDNGASWSIANGGNNESIMPNFLEYNGNLFVSTYTDVFKSNDNGLNWTALSAPIPSGTKTTLTKGTNCLLLSVYGGANNGIFRSTDDGVTWTKVHSGAMNRVQVINGIAFAGGAGVFQSDDDGLTWTNITGTGILNGAIVQCFALFNNKLFIGTHYYVYSSDFNGSTSGLENLEHEKITCYPNPATDKITLVNTMNPNAEFEIYNNIGKLVLIGDLSDSSINVSELQSGHYFIKCEEKTLKIVIQ